MKERQNILAAAMPRLESGKTLLLATVVQTQGSTYRKAGAKLLLEAEGWLAGSISGGCLESDLIQTAWQRTENAPAALVTYDATSENDIVWGYGMGCNGIVQTLLERIVPGEGWNPIRFLQHCLAARIAGVAVTVICGTAGRSPAIGTHGYYTKNERFGEAEAWPDALKSRIAAAALNCLNAQRSHVAALEIGGAAMEIFFEYLPAPVPLVIFGAGQDAVPLARLAHELGWHVTVADHNPERLTRERFPDADVFLPLTGEHPFAALPLHPDSNVVLMTHNYLRDLEILPVLLDSSAGYLGILGPKRRTERLLGDLQSEGWDVTEADRARIYAPVGLDIGAEGPEEIALAVLAEIQAQRRRHDGGFLRHSTGPIHKEMKESKAASLPEEKERPSCPILPA